MGSGPVARNMSSRRRPQPAYQPQEGDLVIMRWSGAPYDGLRYCAKVQTIDTTKSKQSFTLDFLDGDENEGKCRSVPANRQSGLWF